MAHDADHRIRERAYHLWEAAGRPHGRESEFWHQASAEEHAAQSTANSPRATGKPAKAAADAKPTPPTTQAKPPKAATPARKPAATPAPRKGEDKKGKPKAKPAR